MARKLIFLSPLILVAWVVGYIIFATTWIICTVLLCTIGAYVIGGRRGNRALQTQQTPVLEQPENEVHVDHIRWHEGEDTYVSVRTHARKVAPKKPKHKDPIAQMDTVEEVYGEHRMATEDLYGSEANTVGEVPHGHRYD